MEHNITKLAQNVNRKLLKKIKTLEGSLSKSDNLGSIIANYYKLFVGVSMDVHVMVE